MENHEALKQHNNKLRALCRVPYKILQVHGTENVTEFVLHELCQESCFNLTRAAYFVDNPDFDCTKGVAGFSRQEAYNCQNLWDDPVAFSKHMEESSFNKKIRGMQQYSLKRKGDPHHELADIIAQDLGFTNHAYCLWGMKYDNHGFLIYEKADVANTFVDEHGEHGFSLLSFCPIF